MRGRSPQRHMLPMPRRRSLQIALNVTASISLTLGLLCSTAYVIARADQRIGNNAALEAFDQARQMALAREPDQQQWSEIRKTEYRDSLLAPLEPPPGVLSIPSLDLTVAIFEGTSDLALNRGVGWIE